MNQPWGLSGPQFLGVYGAGIAAVIVISLLARQFIRWLPAEPRESIGELDVYQAGYLSGGPRRTAEVIVAELTQAGALRVSSAGLISLVDPGLAAASPAVRAHGVRPGEIPFGDKTHGALKALTRDEGVQEIGRELGASGLIVRPARQRAVLAIAAVLIAALLLTAVARFIEAAANHRPAGDLTGLFILSLVVSFMVVARLRRQPLRTRRGEACLRQLGRAGSDAASAPGGAFPAGTGDPRYGAAYGFPGAGGAALLGVALLGFTAVTDTQLRGALLAGLPSSSSGGGGGYSGGSSCGGGGGCGGGCGG